MAQLLLNRSDLGPAAHFFERELVLEPQSVQAITGLVAIDLSRGKPSNARARVDEFLSHHPNSTDVLVLAAKVCREIAQPAKAEELLNRSLATDPSNPATYGLLAELSVSQKRLGEARKQFAEIVTLGPHSVAAATMMGLLC